MGTHGWGRAPEWMTVLAGMGHSIFLAWSWTRSLLFFTSAYLPVNCSECSNLWKLLLLLGTAGPVLGREPLLHGGASQIGGPQAQPRTVGERGKTGEEKGVVFGCLTPPLPSCSLLPYLPFLSQFSGGGWAWAPSPGTTPVSTMAPSRGSPPPPPCFPNHSSVASGLHGVYGTEGLCCVSYQAGGTRCQGLVLQHAPLFFLSGHLGLSGSHFYHIPPG